MTLRAELQRIVDHLLEQSVTSRQVSLDALGDALGHLSVSYGEIDAMLQALEAEGRDVIGSSAALRGEEHLRAVVASIAVLSAELGRRPKLAEIAAHSGLDDEQVRHALRLASIMQR